MNATKLKLWTQWTDTLAAFLKTQAVPPLGISHPRKWSEESDRLVDEARAVQAAALVPAVVASLPPPPPGVDLVGSISAALARNNLAALASEPTP